MKTRPLAGQRTRERAARGGAAGAAALGFLFAVSFCPVSAGLYFGALLPLVILLEVVGGLTLMLGWQTRITAFLLAGFTIVATLIFHSNLGDQTQMLFFLKNLAIAGGLLLVALHGAGPWSIDNRFGRGQSSSVSHA